MVPVFDELSKCGQDTNSGSEYSLEKKKSVLQKSCFSTDAGKKSLSVIERCSCLGNSFEGVSSWLLRKIRNTIVLQPLS